jgi:glycosyltransferase involved in cell wall biosynthesis
MRVGFDVSPLVRPHPPGVVRAVRGALEALERRAVLEVVRLAPEDGAELRRWRHGVLPNEVRRRELVGLHSFVSAFAWRGPGRRVQTVHELPWRAGVRENAGARHRLWSALGPLFADRVAVPSEHVARSWRAGRRASRAARLRVIPWGVGAPFAPDPPPGTVDEAVLERHRLGGEPLLLCPGAVRAKKDLAAVLRGVAAWRARGGEPVLVVVTGGDTPELRRDLGLAASLGLARWISTLEAVDDGDLAALYRLAVAVPVLSRSEGFAFPVLEGLASGTAVLVPEDGAQAELAGSAGIAVCADDPESVADGLGRALAERWSGRDARAARAAAFSWDACAQRLEALWAELA